MLFDKIEQDIKAAMLAKDADKLETLRAIKGAFVAAKTEKNAQELTEEGELKILQKMVKQREEASTLYIRGNRKDLADKEQNEIKFVTAYLPTQVTPDELEKQIRRMVHESTFTKKDMGAVIGKVKVLYGARADGRLVSELVKKVLEL